MAVRFCVCVLLLTIAVSTSLVALHTIQLIDSYTKLAADADLAIVQLQASGTVAIEETKQEALALIRETRAIAKDLHGKADQSYLILNKTNATTSASTAALYSFIRRVSKEVTGEVAYQEETKQPILWALRDSIQASSKAFEETGRTMETAGTQFNNVGGEIQKGIAETNTLLSETKRPIIETTRHMEETSLNVAESTKSIDVALRPLRKAEGKAKAWLKIISGFFKVTFPL